MVKRYGRIKNFQRRSDKIRAGMELELLVRNTTHRPRNIIAVLTRSPDNLDKYIASDADLNIFRETLKALIEIHPIKITGLTSGLIVEFQEIPLPGGGGKREDITSVKETPSCPVFYYKEKFGLAITNFFTHFAEISVAHRRDFQTPMTFDVMFFEPDATDTVVVRAWHQKDMRFVSMASNPAPVRDFTRKRLPSLEITCLFGGVTSGGLTECKKAQELLDKMRLESANPTWTNWNLAAFPAQAK